LRDSVGVKPGVAIKAGTGLGEAVGDGTMITTGLKEDKEDVGVFVGGRGVFITAVFWAATPPTTVSGEDCSDLQLTRRMESRRSRLKRRI